MDDRAAPEAKTVHKDFAPLFMVDAAVGQAKTSPVFASEEEEAVREAKTTHKYIARIVASMIPMLMLLWIMHTGFKLATEPRRDPKYNRLALLVGVLCIVFGLVYFINGLAIVACLVLELLGWLQSREKKTSFHGDGSTDAIDLV